MEAADHQSSAPGNKGGSSKLLRYPMRSTSKSKEEKPLVAELSCSSATRRGRPAPTVTKSVSILELSGKDMSAKPPRRLSIPAKSIPSPPLPKAVGTITPISEVRMKMAVARQSDTPLSDVSKSSARRKFNVLSSASYWLSQIRLSESAEKHSISLGFFKLALEAECEPFDKMRDELKSYAARHKIVKFGEIVKELLESYNITENVEQLQVSEACSKAHEDGTQSSNDDKYSSSSVTGSRKLKPKCFNTSATSLGNESSKETTNKRNFPSGRRGAINRNSSHRCTKSEVGDSRMERKSQESSKLELSKEKQVTKKSAREEGPVNPSAAEEVEEENKENLDAPKVEEISLADT